jgi:L-asparaginase
LLSRIERRRGGAAIHGFFHEECMNSILMIFTGGTISMTLDPVTGGAVPSLSGEDILARAALHRPDVALRPVEFGKYPGPHMTTALMHDLAVLLDRSLQDEEVIGAVVTHGTDTLEETAYFLDLALGSEKPVILTGSMNHSDDPHWDGPRNLVDGVNVIASGQFRGLGVLVCLDGEINAAGEVTKTHTMQRDTFMSFDFGPVGRIFEDRPVFLRKPYIHEHLGCAPPREPVRIVKCYAGMDDQAFRWCLSEGVAGLVVEAMGTGNVPPPAYDGIASLRAAGIPVVLVSRCPRGATEDVYGYYGAGRTLRQIGVLFARYLNGQKARIKLILALGAGASEAELAALFEGA